MKTNEKKKISISSKKVKKMNKDENRIKNQKEINIENILDVLLMKVLKNEFLLKMIEDKDPFKKLKVLKEI